MMGNLFAVVGHEDVRVRFEFDQGARTPARLVVLTAGGRSQVAERQDGG